MSQTLLNDIAALARFGEKSAENIIEEIEKKKEISLPRFLYSLGILHIGEETASLLAETISNFQFPISNKIPNTKIKISKPKDILFIMSHLTITTLQQIPDIGPKVAQSIYDWFHEKRNIHLLEKLDKAGVALQSHQSSVIGHKLTGLSFVMTGSLESMSRSVAKEKIRALGGDINESISKKTTYVIVGNEPGSKAEQASKLGVKTLNEKEFIKLLRE